MELKGKKVAVTDWDCCPLRFPAQMDHFGIPLSSLTVVNMPPPEGAAASHRVQLTWPAVTVVV